MNFEATIHLEADKLAEALNNLAAALTAAGAIDKAAAPARKSKGKPEPEAKCSESECKCSESEAEPPAVEQPKPDAEPDLPIFDKAKALILRIAKERGREAATQILALYKVGKVTQVPEDKLPMVIADAEKLLGLAA